jgi:hypothetical protein
MAKSRRTVKIVYPDNVNEIGELVGLMYREKGKRNKIFVHAFSRPPKLYISSDGKQIVIIGGKVRFTKRGFED